MIYRFEDLELDTDTFELRRGGERVHVEPQVFGVLAHLIEHRDRVVSKIELLDEVWPDRFVSESALTSRIQAARRACGDSGRDQRVIRTQHGRGYRFVAPVNEWAIHRAAGTPVPRRAIASASARGLVARSAQLAALDAVIDDACAGHRAALVLKGPAGSGKSATVDASLERVDTRPPLVIRAQARAGRAVPEPYVCLLEALGRVGREVGHEVVDVIDRVAPMWMLQLPSLVDASQLDEIERRTLGGTHTRMLREGVDLVEELARCTPLVLVVEDLHWADPQTIEVVEWLCTTRSDTGPSVIVTVRPQPDEAALDETLGRLVAEPRVDVLDLPPLEIDAIATLVTDRLAADSVEASLVEILAEQSAGNPLHVVEQIDLWHRSGDIAVDGARVRAVIDGERLSAQVPESVRHVIESACDRLDDRQRDALRVGAVTGSTFPTFCVAAGLGQPVDDVETCLAALARAGQMIVAVGDDTWPDGTVSTVYRFGHELHRQLLDERLTASKRARIHQSIGERLETAYAHRADEQVAELARHFLAAGDADRAVRYLQRAGEQALARSAHADAVTSFRAALEQLRNLPDGNDRDRREISIRSSLGPALIATVGWQTPELLDSYHRALDLCRSADAPPDRYAVRYGLASVHELRGEYNDSESLLREQLDDGPGLGLETRELLACSLFHQGAFERSLDHARAALEEWDEEEQSRYMARYAEHPGVSCNTWGALSAWHLGQASSAAVMEQAALDYGDLNRYALSTARVQSAFLHQHRGAPAACREMAALTAEVAREQGYAFRDAQAAVLTAWCDVVDGNGSVDALGAAVDQYRTFGARMDEPYFLGLLADAALVEGDPKRARTALDEAAALIDGTTRSFFHEPELIRLRALAIAQLGDGESAIDLLRNAAHAAERGGVVPVALHVALTRHDSGLVQDGEVSAVVADLNRLVAAYPDDISFTVLDRARQLLGTRRA